jgi:HEAT repeat protein
VLPPERAVPILIDALGSAASEGRDAAISAFREVGAAAVPALLKALDSQNFRTRAGAAVALGLIGPPAGAAVPRLQDTVSDKRPLVRQEAAIALGKIGPDARVAIRRLCEMVTTEKDTGACSSAISALQELGADPAVAVPAILTALQGVTDDRHGPAFVALGALRALGPEAHAAVPLLCRFMDSTIDWMRTNSALALAEIGQEAKPAVPLLIRELRDPSSTNRELAARALGELGPVARSAVSSLKGALSDQEWVVRWTAAFALVRIAGSGSPARATVVRILRDAVPDRTYRKTTTPAVTALRQIDPSGSTVFKVLVEVLHDPETREWGPILAHLLRLDPPRETILALVLPRLRNAPWTERRAVRWLGPDPQVLATMIEGLQRIPEDEKAGWTRHSWHWSWMAEALGEFGPAAREAVPTLTEMARRPGCERLAAEGALARITGNVKPALAAAIAALGPDSGEKEWAARALGHLGPAAAPAVSSLLRLLRDADDEVSRAVIIALGRIGLAARPAVPALLALLHGESVWLRALALQALLRMGVEVRTTLGALSSDFWNEKGGASSWAQEENTRKDLEELADSPDVVRALVKALSDEDPATRLRAALTLVRMEKEVHASLLVLAEAASMDPHDELMPLRVRAAEVLAELGPAARDVLPTLKQALGRICHWDLRRVLSRAVAQIENGK